ncbi:MAG: hypothetical protein DRI69_03545 [Bacteroidetes bacterium]|nr:MAG: hypothetical protein DRI69_03545 [Bacteroidota bacterium]
MINAPFSIEAAVTYLTHVKNLYVLLAGIDAYRNPVSKLNGCIKDLDQIEKFLNDYYQQDYNLQILRLADSDATYRNIINGFRDHLCQAGPDDIAWFHFSGHGSEEFTANEFWPIEPKGYDQTLLCYDSGHDSVENMADKELAVLLHEVGSQYPDGSSKETPHIVVSLDCCHSGSGTRSAEGVEELRIRSTPSRRVKREFKSYVDGYYANQDGRVQVPLSTHIVLSACQNIQLAGDLPSGGAFTSGLINALRASDGRIDYVDLFQQTRSAVKKIRDNQTPQFDTIGNLNPYTRFLDGEPFGEPERYEVTQKDGTWYIECGAIHGLPTHPPEPIALEIFTPAPENKSLGEAVIKSVGALKSPIDLDLNIDIKNIFKSIISDPPDYRATLKHLPAPPEIVLLTGESEGVSLLQNHWDSSKSIVATEDDCSDYSIQVTATADGFGVHDHIQNKLAYKTESIDASSAGIIVKALGRIVKWRRFIALENKDRASTIGDGLEFELEVMEMTGGGPKSTIYESDEIQLIGNSSNTMNRAFGINPKIKVLNSERNLFFYCFYIDEQYAIKSPEGERVFRPEERPNVEVYEQTMWSEIQGFGPEPHEKSASAWIKILVTTEELNYEKFLQEGLGASRATFNAWGATLSDDWTTFTTRITVDWKDD